MDTQPAICDGTRCSAFDEMDESYTREPKGLEPFKSYMRPEHVGLPDVTEVTITSYHVPEAENCWHTKLSWHRFGQYFETVGENMTANSKGQAQMDQGVIWDDAHEIIEARIG